MAIKLTPEELRTIASALVQNAQTSSMLADTIKNNVDEALGGWEGEAKAKYGEVFMEIYPTLKTQLPQLITDLANNLKHNADVFEETDRRLAGRG